MIVVSDTSPLRYLTLIGAIKVLPQLFGEVLIPPAVTAELSHRSAPGPVRGWIANPPVWLKRIERRIAKVGEPAATDQVDLIARLGPGEVEAINLALECRADLLLIDDKAGKRAAQHLGLSAVGTIAILDLAGRRGLIDFRKALLELDSSTNFRLSRALREQLLADHHPLDEEDDANDLNNPAT